MNATIELPVEKLWGRCVIDARRMDRNRRRDGATMKAAARLALYRLSLAVKWHAMSEVDDRCLHVSEDFMRDEATVLATVRAMRLPDWVPTPWRIPPDLNRVKFAVPEPPPTAA